MFIKEFFIQLYDLKIDATYCSYKYTYMDHISQLLH